MIYVIIAVVVLVFIALATFWYVTSKSSSITHDRERNPDESAPLPENTETAAPEELIVEYSNGVRFTAPNDSPVRPTRVIATDAEGKTVWDIDVVTPSDDEREGVDAQTFRHYIRSMRIETIGVKTVWLIVILGSGKEYGVDPLSGEVKEDFRRVL